MGATEMKRNKMRQGSGKARRFLAASLAGLLAPAMMSAQSAGRYWINPAAGNGTAGFEGDGAAAKDAKLNYPLGLAVDSSGNVYIADQLNHRIRKVAKDGTISTIAGTETPGLSGNDAAATSASLNYPCGVAVSSTSEVYIADTQNHAVRKINSSGNIVEVSGGIGQGFSELDADSENIDAVDAQLNTPTALTFDAAGNLYIADAGNHRIRKIGTDAKIYTVAGTGTTGWYGDGAAATSAKLYHPTGVAVDAAGNIYIADQMNHRIRKVTSSGVISTIAGTGTPGYSGNGGLATKAQLFYPCCVAVDKSGNLFVSDTTNNRVRMISADGIITAIAGSGRFGDTGVDEPGLNAKLKFPTGITAGPDGQIYFTDSNNTRVKMLAYVAEPGTATAPVVSENGVRTDATFGAFATAAPGSWIEIVGSGLAKEKRDWAAADFVDNRAPVELAGTKVSIGGEAAPLSMVSPERIRAQVPVSLMSGEREVVVTTALGATAPYKLTIEPVRPGVQAPAELKIEGRQYVAATRVGSSSYAAPVDAIAGASSKPARAGETLVIYGTGFGPVTPAVEAGETAGREAMMSLPVEILIGGVPATVTYAGLAQGMVGVYELQFVVPGSELKGAAPLVVKLDGRETGQDLWIGLEE